MKPAGASFPGVEYNEKKIDNGKGELMLMKNFPSFLNENSSKEDVKNYLASISKSNKVKKPQFHAAISTKFRQHTKEELSTIADNFMTEMGYGDQPFIVVFHNDSENNHVHIISSRVDKSTGKKIDDSFERLKSQKALSAVMEKLYTVSAEEKITKLLNYQYNSLSQFEMLFDRNGFKISEDSSDQNRLLILKNGIVQKSLSKSELVLKKKNFDPRIKQLKAILSKYKNLQSNKVFKVEDRRKQEGLLPKEKQKSKNSFTPKIEFESELQKKLRDVFGIDIVFHHKDQFNPFGYSVIDNKTGQIYKGSEILKMNELFEFTSDSIDKRVFESLKDFNIPTEISKQVLLKSMNNRGMNPIKDFMLFANKKRKDKESFAAIRSDVKEYIKNQKNLDIKIIKADDDKYYVVHSKLHYVGELELLIGEKEFEKFINPDQKTESQIQNENQKNINGLNKNISDLLFQISKPSGGSSYDPAEAENKKRRKRKKR